MLVYLVTKAEFRTDILSNQIEEKILGSIQGVLGKSAGNLTCVDRVLQDRETAKNLYQNTALYFRKATDKYFL